MIRGFQRDTSIKPDHGRSCGDCWLTAVIVFGLACLLSSGCSKGLPCKAMHGSVTCGGEAVPSGMVTLIPMPGTAGPASTGLIVDGHYHIEARGGVPLGKHRVLVDAQEHRTQNVGKQWP